MIARILFSATSRLRPQRLLARLVCGVALLGISLVAKAEQTSAPAILRELRDFREMGSVLYIAAHPDDENTELIAYFARGRNYRTGYLSLTRGDGGQNVLGPEFGNELGAIRTEELLAARQFDGGRQFFSRAVDFGFSKDYRETLRIWDRQEVLSDMVRVIREFRPDVLITRFSPIPGGTHGHHTASTILAMEAFKLAGDSKAFPEHKLAPWQPVRIVWNESSFQRDDVSGTNQARIDIGGVDPTSGEAFADIASRSRAMHKTQGFGSFKISGGSGPRYEKFQLLDGEPMTNDVFDGVNTTWSRVADGAIIGKAADEIIAQFNPRNPAVSVPALLKLREQLFGLATDDPLVAEKRGKLDRILQDCLGLEAGTTIAQAGVVPGETMELHHSAVIHSDVPVRWVGVRYPVTGKEVSEGVDLQANQPIVRESSQTLPADTRLSQPYWLRKESSPGMFQVDDPALIGRPENPAAFPVEAIFDVGGQTLVVSDEPVQITTNSIDQETRRRLDVIPPVSLDFASDIALLTPGTSRQVTVKMAASRAGAAGVVQLEMPDGWTVFPASQPFHLSNVGDCARFDFRITAPPQTGTGKIVATAEINGVRYQNQHVEIDFPHIPPLLLQPMAGLKAISLDLATRGHTVGYLSGAGDSLAENLEQMGYAVKALDDAKLTAEQLLGLDAVVIGVRALNVRPHLAADMPLLFDYVQSGGTVIAQYNRPDGLNASTLAPYDLHVAGGRVTDETAEMTLLAPDHPVLNTPNKIGPADFDGWVQERGIYFPDRWDDHFTPIFECHDPGEAPLKGSLLVARYGKGYYVYTGLVFFRELPAGVPGAYRLFANLISLGK